MSLSPDSSAIAAATSTARGIQILAELYFEADTLRYTTNAIDIAAVTQDEEGIEAQRTFTGRGDLVDVSPLGESENSGDETLSLGLSIVNSAVLAACMADASTYRGKPVRLYLQFIDSTFQPAGSPIYVWRGYMDPVSVERRPANGGPSTGRISLPCRRAGMARSRHAEGLRLSDAQQQAEYPGDKGYEYLQTLVERPTAIITKRYLESG